MHELAIGESLVEIIEEESVRQDFSKVLQVRIEVGALGDVEPEALRFCFGTVARGTIAEGADLDIMMVRGTGYCRDCEKTVPLVERFAACPECGNHRIEMRSGGELRIRELEVE